jgi:hypothetical protein
MPDVPALDILQVGIRGLQQLVGRQHLATSHVLLQACQLLFVQTLGLKMMIVHRPAPQPPMTRQAVGQATPSQSAHD